MGQKVNPIGLRTALTRNWESRWFADKKTGGSTQFGEWLHEDLAIRNFIKKEAAAAAIARIQIERFANRVRVTIASARPGVLIGKKGEKLDTLRAETSPSSPPAKRCSSRSPNFAAPRPTLSWSPKTSLSSSNAASVSAAP